MAENIQFVYAERFAKDLEENRSEQEDIARQFAGLQARLERLKTDEKWLAEMLGTMPPAPDATPTATEATPVPAPIEPQSTTPAPAEPDEAAVPQPRQAANKPARKTASKKTIAKKTAAKKATTKKATGFETPATKKTAEPPLRELIEGILTKRAGEPRMVSEIRTELTQAYPERATSIQVVRNNLESLTRKGVIEKGTQQGSVMYTKPAPTQADTTPVPAATADEDNTKIPASA